MDGLRRLGRRGSKGLAYPLYEAWKCVEHGMCLEGSNPMDIGEALWMYIDVVEALEKRSTIEG